MKASRRFLALFAAVLLILGSASGVAYAVEENQQEDFQTMPEASSENDLPSSTAPRYALREEVVIMEDETPLGAGPVRTECCALHFVLMLCSLGVAIYYTWDSKRRQRIEFELRAALQR